MSSEAAVPADAAAPASSGVSAGTMLRNARENAGMHIGALAVALKVPVKKLEALEADRIDLLPDAVFARALAASVCRTLKLDPASVLGLLPGQARPRLQLDAKVSDASFNTPGMGWHMPLVSRLPKPVLVTASVLVVAALVLLFLPSLGRVKSAVSHVAGGESEVPGNAPATNESPAAAATVPFQASEPSPPASASTALPLPPATTSAAGTTPPTTGASAAAVPATVDAQALDGGGVLVFKAHAASWVQVMDAGGVVQLRKTMNSGETAGISGALPLSVTVGRVDAIDVTVRGKPFDLAPVAKDNVARFQVK